jgi:hypothetical protein
MEKNRKRQEKNILINRLLPRAAALKRGKKKFFKPTHDGYHKTQNFMLISKIQTYLSDKMHPKKLF